MAIHMVIHLVKGPDGAIHEFEGPDDATPEEVEAAAEQQFGRASQPAEKIDPLKELEKIQPTAPPSIDQLPEGNPLTGALGTAIGMGQNLGAGLAGQVGALPTALRNIGGSTEPAERKAAEVAQKYAREPTTQAEREYTEKIGSVLGALPPVMGEGFGLAAPGAKQAAGIGSELAGNVGGVASKVAAATTRAILPKPSAQAIALAKKAQDFGIEIPPHEMYNNKFLKIFGETMEHIPASSASADVRREALNKALIREIGGNKTATKLTPDVYEQAMSKYGKTIDELAEKTPVNIANKRFYDKLVDFSNSLSKATPDNQKVVTAYADDLIKQAQNGVVPGKALRELNSQMKTQIRGTADGDLRRHLEGFKNIVEDELMANMSKEDRKTFTDARTKYAKGMALEPLVAKAAGTEGDISPALLMGAVSKGQGKRRLARGTSGNMGDLAAIGQRFLKEPRTSYTAERAYVLGGLGLGGMAAPGLTLPAAAGVYTVANLYNRLGPSITRALTNNQATKTSPTALRGALEKLGGSTPVLLGGALSRVGGPGTGLISRSGSPVMLPQEAARILQAEQDDLN